MRGGEIKGFESLGREMKRGGTQLQFPFVEDLQTGQVVY